jgi:tetratricopeptide (TPR) repeat protein
LCRFLPTTCYGAKKQCKGTDFMKTFSFAFLVIFSLLFINCNQPEEKGNINELPMYGNVNKTKEQIEVDNNFLNECRKLPGGIDSAATKAIKRGWEYFFKNDFSTSMKRFNQAWLLNPKRAEIYWGFGAICGQEGKVDESIKYLEMAISLDSLNGRLYADFGFSLARKGASVNDKNYYSKANLMYEKAHILAPDYGYLFIQWAILKYFEGDYNKSWENIDKAEKLGAKITDQRFLNDLQSKMKRPNAP